MKGQIKRVIAILFAVLFVATMAASAVSAGSVATAPPSISTAALKVSAAYYDDGDGCGNYDWWWLLHHIPVPPRPGPWYSIDQVTQINSEVLNSGLVTSSGAQVNSVIQM